MATRYYFYELEDGTIGSLYRVDLESTPAILDRWDEKNGAWVFSAETYGGISGFASDADAYREITKAEADEYRKKTKSTISRGPPS